MQLQVGNNLQEDVELQSELRHALDVLIDGHENVEVSSQSNVKFIVAYVDVGESRVFKSTLVSQLNGNLTSKNRLTHIKVGILNMKPKLLTTTNHDTMLNIGCYSGVCFWNALEARIITKQVDQQN
jgi:hypothetical protein